MSLTDQGHALADAICRQFAEAVTRLLGGSSTPVAAEAPTEGWHVRLAVAGRGSGFFWIGLSAKDAVAVSKRILGVDEEPADGTVRETLRELAAQAVGGVVAESIGAGLALRVEAVEPSFQGLPSTVPRAWAFDVGDGAPIVLAAWSLARIDEAVPANDHADVAGAESPWAGQSGSGAADNLDLILDIDLPMSVRFGKTELSLGALTRLGPGSVIGLGQSPDEPVEVLVSGRVVARGGVVVVGGNFGVRITDVVQSGRTRGH